VQTVTQLGWFEWGDSALNVFGLRDESEYETCRRGWYRSCIMFYGRYRRVPWRVEMWAPVSTDYETAAWRSLALAWETAEAKGLPTPEILRVGSAL
jgi:hypothetical protein